MPAQDPILPEFPCPECLDRASKKGRIYKGRYRIGNQRGRCKTCNDFSQAVMRLTRARLIKEYAKEYEKIRLRVEFDLYPQVIQDYERANPWAADPLRQPGANVPVEVPVQHEPGWDWDGTLPEARLSGVGHSVKIEFVDDLPPGVLPEVSLPEGWEPPDMSMSGWEKTFRAEREGIWSESVTGPEDAYVASEGSFMDYARQHGRHRVSGDWTDEDVTG